METAGKSQKLLRIHRSDNVLIVVASIRFADKELLDRSDVVFEESIAIGHKVAARLIAAGEKVIKCGVQNKLVFALLCRLLPNGVCTRRKASSLGEMSGHEACAVVDKELIWRSLPGGEDR
jgi:hypothetical protein